MKTESAQSQDAPDISNLWEKFKLPLIFLSGGVFLLIIGLRLTFFSQPAEVKFISNSEATRSAELLVDVAGEVTKPGVYKLPFDSRLKDLLVAAGGLTDLADREWINKNMNLAMKLTDASKIYIPSTDETQADSPINNEDNFSNTLSNHNININNASIAELDTLAGVGEVTAKKIIDNRPYGTIDELLTKKVVSKSVFEKIKEKITVY